MLFFDISVLYLVITKQIEHLLIYKAKFGFFLLISVYIYLTFISIRSSVFHAFLSHVPKVVDYNFNLGTILLPFFLSFLHFPHVQIHQCNCMNTYQQQILSNELILIYMILILILCKVNFFYKNNKNNYLKKILY
jgi:hypothetical protein